MVSQRKSLSRSLVPTVATIQDDNSAHREQHGGYNQDVMYSINELRGLVMKNPGSATQITLPS